ncbi:MAG: GNAT family N-acetyltransferase [Planctomycetes bacterium]|nr:GNAT family N-acetyltransferase [Planctomycetota bacterium]
MPTSIVPSIEACSPSEWPAAFELAFSHLDEPGRSRHVHNALTLVAAGEIEAGGILVARVENRIVGLQIAVPLKGAGGLVWPPRFRCADRNLEHRLVRAALEWLDTRGAKLVHALLSSNEIAFAGPLIEQGFRQITRLRYLRHDLTAALDAAPRLRWAPYSAANRELFNKTILLTYEQTLDCPELNGLRTVDEIIAGHLAQGRPGAARWWLAFEKTTPVGVLLTTKVPDEKSWDLSYMGLIAAARGRGLGRDLAAKALHEARAAGAPQLILAVDERNAPALQLYRSLGFAGADFREVFLHVMRPPLADRARGLTGEILV